MNEYTNIDKRLIIWFVFMFKGIIKFIIVYIVVSNNINIINFNIWLYLFNSFI